MLLAVIVLVALTSIAASVITTRFMTGHCFKSIDRYLEETLETVKKVSLDALEEMKNR